LKLVGLGEEDDVRPLLVCRKGGQRRDDATAAVEEGDSDTADGDVGPAPLGDS